MIHIHIKGTDAEEESRTALIVERAFSGRSKAFTPYIRNYSDTDYRPSKRDRDNLARAGVQVLITTEKK